MPGWIEIAVVLIILILLFGRGKISDLMGDVAKGITSFKKGLKEEDKDKDKAKADTSSETKKVAEAEPVESAAARVAENEKDAAASG